MQLHSNFIMKGVPMKRFFAFFLVLVALGSDLVAATFYPVIRNKLDLQNGHTLELDFAAPQEALKYFDATILTEGFSKLLADNALDCDFTVMFVPRNMKGDISLSVSFDNIDISTADSLKPSVSFGTNQLYLGAPARALSIMLKWYNSFLVNQDPGKNTDIVSQNQPMSFVVFYSAKGQSKQLTFWGIFSRQNLMEGVHPDNGPVFNPVITYTDTKTFKSTDIPLSSSSKYNLPLLQYQLKFVLDPVSDRSSGSVYPSSLIYDFFALGLPQ
jgi:hypothetical protein